jgi:hypothetical protein
MRSYNDALIHYNRLTTPPRSKKWRAMPDNAKPLVRVGTPNKSIHMTSEGAIYYKLYDTKIATFYPPNADGEYLVECKYYNSITTNTFMNDNWLSYTCLTASDDSVVRVPYVAARKTPLSASLVFNAQEKLIVSKSHHPDVYTSVTSPEDRAKRRELMAELDILVTLCELKLEQYRADVTLEEAYGAPFMRNHRRPSQIALFEQMMNDLLYRKQRDGTPIDVNNKEFVDTVLELGQGVFDILASSRAYERDGTFSYRAQFMNHDARRDAINSVTTEDFKRSLYNRLLKGFRLDKGSARKVWGQFMPTLPTKMYA